MTSAVADSVVKRHPIRGVIWGLVAGLGLAIHLVIFAVIAFGTLTPYVVILLCGVAGGLWGAFAPAKRPKGGPPQAPTVDREPAPAPTEPEAEAEGASEVLAVDEPPEE